MSLSANGKEPINVAVLGGSFDPPHIGHIRTMEVVLEQCPFIHSVWMVPTRVEFASKKLIPYQHRLAMCYLAAAEVPHVHVSDCEERYQSVSTWGLVTSLQMDREYSHIKFHWIIGSDCLMSIDQWVNFELLIKAIPFIIVPRVVRDTVERIPTHIKNWIYEPQHTFIKTPKGKKHITPNISSTKIKNAFAAGMVQPLSLWLNPNVLLYAQNYGFYPKRIPDHSHH